MPLDKFRVEIKVTDLETNTQVASAEGSVPNEQAFRAVMDVFSAISMAHLLGCSWGRETATANSFYLRYDHSAGPGPRDDEFIGPFPSGSAALQFRSERFAAGAPVMLEVMDEPPPAEMTMTPEEAASYQDARG